MTFQKAHTRVDCPGCVTGSLTLAEQQFCKTCTDAIQKVIRGEQLNAANERARV